MRALLVPCWSLDAGAAKVSLPILPPLWAATRAQSVIGPTYLLTQHGQSFASAAASVGRGQHERN